MLLPINMGGENNPIKSQFLALAISDTALFHVSISLAALHLALVTQDYHIAVRRWGYPVTKAPAYHHHKREAIQCLSRQSGTADAAASDARIGTLVHLGAWEVRMPGLSYQKLKLIFKLTIPKALSGNFSDFQKYMISLEAMVKRRGGLRNLGLNGLLHKMVHW